MAVNPQPHNEAWKVVNNMGQVFGTYGNGRDALAVARTQNMLNRVFEHPAHYQAVRA